jgi:hypothetical protein
MKVNQIIPLTEIMWEERYSAMKVAAKYPNDYIHFTSVPKLGVNPSKAHRDPPGIYFYPCRWLLAYEASSSQYATHLPYFYICRISPGKIINLSRMTMAQVQKIATANGWIADFQRCQADPSKLLKMDKKLLKKPGGIFYATMDYLANMENRSWLTMLRGIDGLMDTGHGIISPNETHQIVVINKKLIKILEFGENKDQVNSTFANLLQRAATELGGKFYYKNRIPQLDVVIDGKPIHAELDAGNWKLNMSYYKDGFWVQRIEKYADSDTGDTENEYRDLLFKLKRDVNDAGTEVLPLYWNKDRVTKIVKDVLGTYIRYSGVKDEQASYRAIWDGHYNDYLTLTVTRDDELTVHASIASRSNYEPYAEVNQSFQKGTDANKVSSTILDQLANDMKDKNPGGWDVTGIGIFSHFQLDDRLGNVAEWYDQHPDITRR